MFDKFGEFDSADEMNRAAAAQRKEGDNEAILAIAEENGIDREDAMDFMPAGRGGRAVDADRNHGICPGDPKEHCAPGRNHEGDSAG